LFRQGKGILNRIAEKALQDGAPFLSGREVNFVDGLETLQGWVLCPLLVQVSGFPTEVPEIKEREIPVICYDIIFYGISIFSFL
jgi:hypothetical protein